MKTKALKDLRGKDAEALTKLLVEKRAALQQYGFNMSGSKVKNVKEGSQIRKDIAQILTIMSEQRRTK